MTRDVTRRRELSLYGSLRHREILYFERSNVLSILNNKCVWRGCMLRLLIIQYLLSIESNNLITTANQSKNFIVKFGYLISTDLKVLSPYGSVISVLSRSVWSLKVFIYIHAWYQRPWLTLMEISDNKITFHNVP